MSTAELCLSPAVHDPLESIMRMVLDSVTAENTKIAVAAGVQGVIPCDRQRQALAHPQARAGGG